MKNNLKIVTIGGGSGMPVVNRALVKLGYRNISSIVTTFDSGGDSGRMRTDERGQILAFSDYWRSLMSLWEDGEQKEVWQEMLQFRDGRGRNFGNIFFQFMSEKSGNLSNVDSLFESLTGARLSGEVVPVSLSPADVSFGTRSGKNYVGEHNLDNLRMSLDKVDKIWLTPEVDANKEALTVLGEAEVIIVCPGSMYGSVLTNFLPKGMREAYNLSQGKKILMTNIMSVANENYDFDQDEYAAVFERYLNTKKPFDLVLMANLEALDRDRLQKVLEFYSLEHARPIKYCPNSPIKTIVADISKIEESNWTLRHSAEKLTKVLEQILETK